jgi:hypothetical protein
MTEHEAVRVHVAATVRVPERSPPDARQDGQREHDDEHSGDREPLAADARHGR